MSVFPASVVMPAASTRLGSVRYHYWAFISYSHRDAKAAAGLQRALESYRLPRLLVGTTTESGVVPSVVKPVFRDREELPAAADLKASVRVALTQSRWLIVLCSPAAAQSAWVNLEITEFKRVHGDARVLAVILAGEPFSSGKGKQEGDECFPPALRFAPGADGEPAAAAIEPSAVDLRRHGDGKRYALLKLVAGMTGVGVDELVHRDARRRARRLGWLALGATAGMLIMTVLTIMAVRARNDAQQRRAQAEDLVEFMLGDLRMKLEPVGRLELLDAVGTKALAHYASQPANTLEVNELSRRARALHLIGEIREQRGNLAEASRAFKVASDSTAQLLARDPNNVQRMFDHAQSVYWVGYVSWLRHQAPQAEESFREYLALARRLVLINPQNGDWRLEVAYATQNLGNLYLDNARSAEALAAFKSSRDVYLSLVARRPALRIELANVYGWIAKAEEHRSEYRAAVIAQRSKIEILGRALDVDTNRQVQLLVANGYFELGQLQLNLGKLNSALLFGREAVKRFDELVALDATNVNWRGRLCLAQLGVAAIQIGRSETVDAEKMLSLAAASLERIQQIAPIERERQHRLRGQLLTTQAQVALTHGRPMLVRPLSEFVMTMLGLASSGHVFDQEQLRMLAAAQMALGDVLARDHRLVEARSHWQVAASEMQSSLAHNDLPGMVLLARLSLRNNQVITARRLTSRVRTSIFRHPDYVELEKELALGRHRRIEAL